MIRCIALFSAAIFAVSAISAESQEKTGDMRLRGFTVDKLLPENLESMKKDWNANSVRVMLRPNFVSTQNKMKTYSEGWDKLVKEMPAYLDKAAELRIGVILDLHEVPNDNQKTYGSDRKKQKSEFWHDRSNLDVAVKCWKQIAELCKGRKQVIWYDILNEPLDWEDFPKYVKVWPEWAQTMIDEIRKIDAEKAVVVEVGPGGLCWGFKDFPVLKGANIIYSTHQYQPHQYTHQGISGLNNTDLAKAYLKMQQKWPGEFSDTGGGMWDKARLYKELAPMIKFQKKNNVRIYISEFGVVRWSPNSADYVKDNLEIFEEFGWDWSFHAYKENPIWDPEYEPVFGDNVKAKETTPVGTILKKFFEKNWK